MGDRRYDWVFFDVGETLVRVADPPAEYARVLENLGYGAEPKQMLAAFNAARQTLFSPDHVGPAPDYAIDRELATARRERFVAALIRELGVRETDIKAARLAIVESLVGPVLFGLYPDAVPSLRHLRAAGHRIGVVSNWEPRLEMLCRNHGLADFFELVVASEAEGYAKPSRRLFERALALAGAEPHRVIHVGDSYEHDVLGATGAGIDAVLLDRGRYYEPGRWNPTICSLAALTDTLENMAKVRTR